MCMKVLVAMCHSISDKEGCPLLDIDASPWNKMSRMKICPNSDQYCRIGPSVEAIEASSPFKQEGEQPGSPPQSGWKLTKLHDWLCNHPILANVDNDFLAKVVAIRKSASHKAADETSRDDAKLQPGTGLGSIPLYGCFMLSSTMRTSRVPAFVEWNFPLAIWLLRTVCILSLCGQK